ncbi:MAG: hypothetical protein LBT89_07830 [Planctomycetaceae bacterium]|jgi:hypothetical protein|nr:hypothetical protein [Planctomycetaceae bacterium]
MSNASGVKAGSADSRLGGYHRLYTHSLQFHCVLLDGSVRRVSNTIAPQTLEALAIPDDGKEVRCRKSGYAFIAVLQRRL